MREAFVVLFLVAPGFLGWILLDRIKRPDKETSPTLLVFFGSVMFSVWIDTLNCLLLKLFFPMNALEDLFQNLNRMDFLFCFAGLSLISMIVTALTWNILMSDAILWLAERIGRPGFMHRTVQSGNVWRSMFEKDNQPHAVLVEKEGKVVGKGLLKFFHGDFKNLKGVYLEKTEQMDQFPNGSEFRGTYIDFDKDLIVREFELPVRAVQKKKVIPKTLKIRRLNRN